MLHGDALGLLLGAVALGAVHGMEPGHGWPVAASYALDQRNKWVSGFAASLILGVGHLVSSIAMVGVFFYAKGYFNLTEVNEPITVLGGVQIGGPVSLVAGGLLVILGVREYLKGGHSHDTSKREQQDGVALVHTAGHDHEHENDYDHGHPPGIETVAGDSDEHDHGHGRSHTHSHSTTESSSGLLARLKQMVPFTSDHGHSHSHAPADEMADRGLLGIAWFAFLLGFAHEEEFEIIALCAGSTYCLELVAAYALTVIFGIVGLTLLLISGYQHFEEETEKLTPYLPAFSAVVLVVMGVGFIVGVF